MADTKSKDTNTAVHYQTGANMKVLELVESRQQVYVVGDSIGVGIQNAGGAPGITKGGQDTKVILGFISTLIKEHNLQNAIVILSTGASNSTFERESGESKSLDTGPIVQQVTMLKNAGAKVVLVGTGSSQSKWFTSRYGKYRVNFEKEQVNQKLASIASQTGATFLGPLEDFDPSLNNKGDGIHPYNGYKKLFQAGSAVTTTEPEKAERKTMSLSRPRN